MHKFLLLIVLFTAFSVCAQQSAKRPLTFEDYSSWKTLENQQISHNGKVITYEINPQKGDGMLVVHNADTKHTVKRATEAQISPENNFVVFRIKQPEDTIRKARLNKVKDDEIPGDSLGIFVFSHDSVALFPDVKSFQIPGKGAEWIAFTRKVPEKKDSLNGKETKGKHPEQPGDLLVLFHVQSGDTLMFDHVTEYFYPKEGNHLYFISQHKDSVHTYSTIRVFHSSTGEAETLFASDGWSRKAVSDYPGNQYVFLHSVDTVEEKTYALYYGITGEREAEVLVNGYTSGIPVGWVPGEHGDLYFSADGSKLYLGTAESPVPEPKDTLLEEEKPKLDVWHWQDMTLQPQQKIELEKEKKRTYLSVYHLDLDRFIQLADIHMKNVTTLRKGNGKVALGSDETPYQRASSWTGEQNRDYYLIDLESGIRWQMVTNNANTHLSPGGRFVVWYDDDDSSYYARSTQPEHSEKVPLTRMIPVSFYNERHDTPSDPRPYGIAGWAPDDQFVFLYDRYDIWKIDPSGRRVPVNVTKAFGRRNKTRLRYLRLDREEEFIPVNKPVILEAFDERTISSGFFKTTLNEVKDPEWLLMDTYSFSRPQKAKEADRLIWTKENVKTFPDVWVSDLTFGKPTKLSEANPQQDEYNWVDVEMVEWTSFTGEDLRGLLYKPENFDPGKKYPTVVYFYERSSETLHHHTIPYPSRSTINKTFYCSNGYLVFVPDITYETGYPGESAYNAIVSGVYHLMATYPFVDQEHIGLQGQSWGGYQTVYLITRTDLFVAAMGGAPVSNMTSAYGGIRWASGMSRMFQYEHTQSRIGGSLWEKPLLYIENSPVFYAPKIETPLLMMHNDDDGAVPWYQGIEMFVALRRLDKPVWMLSYNGEPHNLKDTSWANRVDLSKRMFQFFNHYLKRKPMPEWMKKGIPATEKGKTLGY
jgi:dipeptidyl aminopeptidase/acylaminoacyl peptidase